MTVHRSERPDQPVFAGVARCALADDRPRMALQRQGDPLQPLNGQLTLAKLEMADLLIAGSHQSSERGE